MIEYLDNIDRAATLFLNGFHTPWFDNLLFNYSKMWVWSPFYLIYIWHLAAKSGRKNLWWLAAIVLAILISDQISSGILKPTIERLRPSHDLLMRDLIHIVNEYRGGRFGFTSSHASNSVAAATILILIFKSMPQTIMLILWAAIMGYSRIYLGVHYLGDVLCGSLVGVFAGWLSYKLLSSRMNINYAPQHQRSINRDSSIALLVTIILLAII
ncbi:MAG: phosphatase PAP2 family protein [Bacteroidales bacterium]